LFVLVLALQFTNASGGPIQAQNGLFPLLSAFGVVIFALLIVLV
jgi:hypothetical protein